MLGVLPQYPAFVGAYCGLRWATWKYSAFSQYVVFLPEMLVVLTVYLQHNHSKITVLFPTTLDIISTVNVTVLIPIPEYPTLFG